MSTVNTPAKLDTPVKEIMVTDLITVEKSKSMSDVNKLFETNQLHHLPIVEGDKLVGIISLHDHLRISYGFVMGSEEAEEINENVYSYLTIEQVMTENPITITPESTVKEAAAHFNNNMFHALPVVQGDKLVGMITTLDLLNFLMK